MLIPINYNAEGKKTVCNAVLSSYLVLINSTTPCINWEMKTLKSASILAQNQNHVLACHRENSFPLFW